MTTPVQVRIKRLPHGQDLPLPARQTALSSGFDLHAAVRMLMKIDPGCIQLVPCGFAMALPPGYEAQVRPRSGMASQHGVAPVNSPGTIDADYRGEVKVPLINHGPNTFIVERGMRIAQMVIVPVPAVDMLEVDDLDATARGEGGFGHTGS